MTITTITPAKLLVLDPVAYRHLQDESGEPVRLRDDDRLEHDADSGNLYLWTRGGDPGCALEMFTWHPDQEAWVALVDG